MEFIAFDKAINIIIKGLPNITVKFCVDLQIRIRIHGIFTF